MNCIFRVTIFLLTSIIPASVLAQAEPDRPGAVSPDDEHDWVQLTSGEWLKGELIGVFNDEVEFDSDILDDLKIDEEDVSRILSPRTLAVRIEGHDLMRGKVRIDEGFVVVVVDGEEEMFPREGLVSLTRSAQRELDRWSGKVSLGTNLRQGNTDLVEYNMIAGLERRTAVSRAFIDYIGNFNKTLR